MNEKISAAHVSRRAVIYPRQSSMRQLVEHRESTVRQYALQERALALGWTPEQVEVIDCDLGHSATTASDRLGFQRLAEEVARGRVGAIFALECSRLARCSADWQKLLELCGLADVLLIDEQRVYAPRDADDRLLLGLKGTLSEAELHWMKLRLQGAIASKALRGELKVAPPTGYDWDVKSKQMVLCSDGRVREAIALVFERFRVDRSASAVASYFFDNGLELPAVKSPEPVRWRPPNYIIVLRILRNPIYAGAYVYGRRHQGKALVNGEIRACRIKTLPREQWKVCILGRHPGYIDWDEYLSNQKKLDGNRYQHADPNRRGAPRSGEALLQGIVLCGRCGARMHTQYQTRTNSPRYNCVGFSGRRSTPKECWSVAAALVDQAVVERFLGAVVPSNIDLSLLVANEVQRQTEQLNRQWQLKLEQARYEARHAERRYRAVDPENRVVAGTLEKDWNDALVHVMELEASWEDEKRTRHLELTDEDRRRVRQLSGELPRVWSASTTTIEDRKQLLRLLIQEVGLSPVEAPASGTRVRLLWKTGIVDEFFVERAGVGWMDARKQARRVEIMAEILRLKQAGSTDEEVAARLNARGILSGRDRPWTRKAVEGFRLRDRRRTSTNKGKMQGKANHES